MGKDERDHKYTLKDKYYPRITQFLPKTEKVLFNYIGSYRDRNTSILNSPYPDTQLKFFMEGEDANILFRCTNIDRDELLKDVKNIELPTGVDDKNALNEVNVIFILLMKYYLSQKNIEKTTSIILYYAYSLYGWRWWMSFKPYGANPGVMRYTVNNLSGKFGLKKYGSIDNWLKHILFVSIETYREKFVRLSDRDIDELITALVTRVSSALKNLRDAYEKAYRNKSTILESKEFIDNTTVQLEQESFTGEVEKLTLEYTQEFFSIKPASKRILTAAKFANISVNELQMTIDKVFDNAEIDEAKEFFRCLFTVYYKNANYKDIRDVKVKSAKFLQEMEGIFRKGNSKDPNILKAKDIIDTWLKRSSKTFNKSTCEGTIINFRRGVYMYFILLISGIG